MRVARPGMPVREGELTMTAPIVLATGGHSDTSLCYVRRGEYPAPLCEDTGRWYVHAGATYTRVCDRHISEVRAMPGFDFARPLQGTGPGRLFEFPDACPESRMEDGAHSTDYEDSGRCSWCGEANPDAQCSFCGNDITLIGGSWTTDEGTTACTDTSAPYVPHKPKES
jgi:hypothetical protein